MTVLVIDVGSSSARALLFDASLQPVPGALASRAHSFTTTPPGASTADADALRALVEACIDDVLAHPAARDIAVVGMATFAGSVLGVDADGGALTPVYTYADTRSADDVLALAEMVDTTALHQQTGCVHHTAYLPARLRWLRRTQPDVFERATRWVDFGTYLYTHWFGETPCSYSVASWSGMLNRETLRWEADWLRALNLDADRLPRLADYDAPLTGLKPAYAKRWPGLRDVPFCLAVGDGAAANIGLGAVGRGYIALTVGTTAALRTVSDAHLPPVPAGLWGYRVDAHHHLIGGATSEGGSIFQWARAALNLPGEAEIEAHLRSRPPDAHGLTFLPLLAGERSPGWSPNATGAVTGLRLSTTPLDILQAALEGVALRLALIADRVKSLVDSDAVVVAGGGALSSGAWAQIIANALGRPLDLTGEAESTARGVAILANRAAGRGQLENPPLIARRVTPQPDAVTVMRAALERQTALYDHTII